jgi:hypothetical protein
MPMSFSLTQCPPTFGSQKRSPISATIFRMRFNLLDTSIHVAPLLHELPTDTQHRLLSYVQAEILPQRCSNSRSRRINAFRWHTNWIPRTRRFRRSLGERNGLGATHGRIAWRIHTPSRCRQVPPGPAAGLQPIG